MLLQPKLVTGILAGPNLGPGTPGLTLSQSAGNWVRPRHMQGSRRGSELSMTCLYWQEHGEMKETGCAHVHPPESLMRLEMRRGLEKESKGIRELLCGEQRLKLQINSLFLINYQLQL